MRLVSHFNGFGDDSQDEFPRRRTVLQGITIFIEIDVIIHAFMGVESFFVVALLDEEGKELTSKGFGFLNAAEPPSKVFLLKHASSIYSSLQVYFSGGAIEIQDFFAPILVYSQVFVGT